MPFIPYIVSSIREVEKFLDYEFKSVSRLEEALTHSSYTHPTSYERLEFMGDAAVGLAITKFLFETYPELDPGQLTLLRVANVSTEKLARAAVNRGLHRCVRHKIPADDAIHGNVTDFVMAVEQEDEKVVFGGKIKPPKILANIVESVAAAVYIDCRFDWEVYWPIFKRLLEPLVTLDLHPLVMLLELCKRDGRKVKVRRSKEGTRNIKIATVVVDGDLIASAPSKKWENASIHAAKTALQELSYHTTTQPSSHSVESAQELPYITTRSKPLSHHLEPSQEVSYNNDYNNELDGCGEIERANTSRKYGYCHMFVRALVVMFLLLVANEAVSNNG